MILGGLLLLLLEGLLLLGRSAAAWRSVAALRYGAADSIMLLVEYCYCAGRCVV